MTNPAPTTSSRSRWLWPALIALFAVILVAVLVNPSGDRDGTVRDPIVIEDTGTSPVVGDPALTADGETLTTVDVDTPAG